MLHATILAKTDAGQRVLKDRSLPLAPRQRSAFILFDGRRTLGEVLQATAGSGLEPADVQAMVDAGVLQEVVAAGSVVAAGAAGAAPPSARRASPTAAASTEPDSGRSPQQRYRDAYAIAAELTGALGLRGFRLNLAVEGVGDIEGLRALAPKIRDAVGADKYARLDRAMNG